MSKNIKYYPERIRIWVFMRVHYLCWFELFPKVGNFYIIDTECKNEEKCIQA